MKETWYKIKKDEKYCAEVLDIFCGLHDYMIKDKNNEIIPLTEGRLNPTWRTRNYETGKYEDIRRHFDVFEADE